MQIENFNVRIQSSQLEVPQNEGLRAFMGDDLNTIFNYKSFPFKLSHLPDLISRHHILSIDLSSSSCHYTARTPRPLTLFSLQVNVFFIIIFKCFMLDDRFHIFFSIYLGQLSSNQIIDGLGRNLILLIDLSRNECSVLIQTFHSCIRVYIRMSCWDRVRCRPIFCTTVLCRQMRQCAVSPALACGLLRWHAVQPNDQHCKGMR